MAKLSKKTKAARKKPGGSNVGTYKDVKSFCGPAGGAPAGSFPTNTIERGRSALKLAHNALIQEELRLVYSGSTLL